MSFCSVRALFSLHQQTIRNKLNSPQRKCVVKGRVLFMHDEKFNFAELKSLEAKLYFLYDKKKEDR